MHSAAGRLQDAYQQELAALRDEASEFAQDYPDQAQALGIHRGRSQDPQVELLMQSFAYLTGRLRHQLEVDQADLPNALLADLYPHLEAPLPCMMVAEFEVQPDGMAVIERGRSVRANVRGDQGGVFACRLRTCFETALWPLQVGELAIVSPDDYPGLAGKDGEVRGVLKVRLLKQGHGLLDQTRPQKLRFHLNPEGGPAHRLHHLLGAHLRGLAVAEPGEGGSYKVRALADEALHWLGFEDDEAALPAHPQAHPAFRILQEYFAFPEKFLFFDVALEIQADAPAVDLLFLLDVPPDPGLRLSPALLRTNCVPLINLYSQRIDPLTLDHSRYEYRLTGDATQHANCEIYRIERLDAVRAGSAPRRLVPYFSMDGFQHIELQDYFYFTRREATPRARIGGTELYVSFLDAHFELCAPADDVIGGSALCTNRRMPERLRIGDLLEIEGAAPVTALRVLGKPSAHQTPPMTGARPWLLASQLALNHLSLTSGPQALAALKEVLRMHVGPASTLGRRAIDGIHALDSRPLLRWHGRMGRRGYVQGCEIDLALDSDRFEETSAVLFAAVLRHFFALYASVNTVVQLRLHMKNVKGVVKEWPPLAGNQVLL
ncbi:type VI secretion system baseplate subunit TssF [Pseudothauera nasutitermitis]|uniref:Type VI secretion system baseplate subunit TssF n=1 Tax=Pseudothauera nasutitermitis TaxID=2565930 RepID=A0A4S4AUR4_9RHOO|nr:type VI secretion system baseplate subunit TssF [Pseudothauera nasutitermitis]THF63709.1 type VI secretion system baseplate subunit TssF [Pseudothauera nasutitermitis]